MKSKIKCVGVEVDGNGKQGRFYIGFWNNHKMFTKGKLSIETEMLIRYLQAEVIRT